MDGAAILATRCFFFFAMTAPDATPRKTGLDAPQVLREWIY